MATTKKAEVVEIKPVELRNVTLKIVGDTPLIVHAWSEKAKRMMLEAQMDLAKGKKKEVKNPVDDFIQSMYWLTDKPKESTEEAFMQAIKGRSKVRLPCNSI